MFKHEKIGLLVLLAIFAAFFFLIFQHDPRVRMYPAIVCGVGFFFTVVQLCRTVAKEKKNDTTGISGSLTKPQLISVAVTLGASILYVVLIPILGYFVSTFLFVVLYSFWHTNTQKKWMYPVVGLGLCVVIYVAFKLFLNIPLPKGFLI